MYKYINWIMELLPETFTIILISVLLGLLLGIEREWSNKPSGVRTFALVCLTGGVFTMIGMNILIYLGFVMVIFISFYMFMQNFLVDEYVGLSLTTSVSLMLTYGVGILVGGGDYTAAVTIAVAVSLLLILRNELHGFASNMNKKELRSITQFAIIAIVVTIYIPDKQVGPYDAIDLQLSWMLVVAISAIGFANYILFKKYQEKGFLITSFFGGLVNSTATIVELSARSDNNEINEDYMVSLILITNTSMILRNLALVTIFLISMAYLLAVPLLVMSIAFAFSIFHLSNWDLQTLIGEKVNGNEIELKTPFSVKNALLFGFLFIIVLVLSTVANEMYGGAGFIMVSFLGGLVSSGTVTTSVILLTSTNQVSPSIGSAGLVAGIISSILVKIMFVSVSDPDIKWRVAKYSLMASVIGMIVTVAQYSITRGIIQL